MASFAAVLTAGGPRRAFSAAAARAALRTLAGRSAAIAGPLATRAPRNPALAGLPARFASALTTTRSSKDQAPNTRLVQLLHKEIEHESRLGSQDEENELFAFLKSSDWKLNNKEGQDEVTITKNYGTEKISVTFSLSEVSQQEDHYDDELDEGNDEDMEKGEDERSFSVNAIVNCEKAGHGVLTFQITFEDCVAMIQSVSYYPSGDIAKMEDLKADWKRRALYGGPEFTELDDDLQDTFREYIEVRGIDSNLGDFITRYVTFGEQKEYVSWLQRVKKHISA